MAQLAQCRQADCSQFIRIQPGMSGQAVRSMAGMEQEQTLLLSSKLFIKSHIGNLMQEKETEHVRLSIHGGVSHIRVLPTQTSQEKA